MRQGNRAKKSERWRLASMEWTPSGFRRLQHFDLGQDAGCLGFQARAHAVIISLGEFARLKFETQIAQVLVNYLFPLIKVSGPSFDDSSISIAAGIEDVNQDAGGKHTANHL